MAKFKFDIQGVDEVQRALGRQAASALKRQVADDISEGVDAMAEGAYDNAPVETGALRSSILASVKREGLMEYIFGSHLPYAQRQEYEHKTKKAYFRRAIWAETPQLESKLAITIKRRLGG